MTSPIERFAFVDSMHAAEFLHVSQDTVLDWIKSGRIRTFGGKPGNPFLRSADVLALAEEVGVQGDEPARRVKSGTAKVQTRLTADSRWAEISQEDIRDWVARSEKTRRAAARSAVEVARQRLGQLMSALDDAERRADQADS